MSDFGRTATMQEEMKAVPRRKDSMLLSIIFMNVFSLGCVGHAVMFKVIIGGGMAMPDYFLFRNAFLWMCSIVEISLTGVSVSTDFPSDRPWTLISKCVLS